VAELTRSIGRGGRPRRLGDDTEKARKTVTARVHRALRLLGHPPPGAGGAPAPGRPHRHDLPLRAHPIDWEL